MQPRPEKSGQLTVLDIPVRIRPEPGAALRGKCPGSPVPRGSYLSVTAMIPLEGSRTIRIFFIRVRCFLLLAESVPGRQITILPGESISNHTAGYRRWIISGEGILITEENNGLSLGKGSALSRDPVYPALGVTCGLAAALMGILGLVGLVFGIQVLTSVFPGLKPIALSASLAWIILGFVLAARALRPWDGVMQRAASAVVLLIAVVCALELPLNLAGTHFMAETFLIRTGDVIFPVPSTPISPLAVILILLSFGALFLMLVSSRFPARERVVLNAVGLLGSVVTLVSFTILLSHLYGKPFLYGSVLIPIALTSALAGLFAGAGLIFTAGPESFPLSIVSGTSIRARLLQVLLPLIVAIIFIQNFLDHILAGFPFVENTILVTILLVVFVIIAGFLVGKISGAFSRNLEREQRERKKAEDAEKEARAYLGNLVSYANAPIITWDPEYRITEFNHAFEVLTGLPRQDVMGKNLHILFPEESCEKSMALIRSTSAGERWEVVEIPIRHISGETRIVLWNSANVSGPDGNLAATVAQGMDITDRKAAEEALRQKSTDLEAAFEEITATEEELRANYGEMARNQQSLRASELRLRSFYDSGLFGVIFWTMDGKITDANDAFLSMTGYSREDLEAGRVDWAAMTPPELRYLDEISVEELRSSGINRVPFEKEYIRKDGTRFPVMIAGAMTDEQRFNGVAFVLDVSERKTAEARFAAAQQQYLELFENVSVGLLRSTPGPAGKIIEANPATIRIFEADSKEQFLAARPGDLYFDPDQRRRVSDEILAHGFIRGMEVRYKSLKGRPFWGRISATMKHSGDGSEYFDNSIEDITERRLAEEALRESEERLLLALGVSQMGTWDLDLVSHTAHRTLRHDQIFGYADLLPEWTYEMFLGHVLPEDRS
jgi:PAS domain S-box-containing protein